MKNSSFEMALPGWTVRADIRLDIRKADICTDSSTRASKVDFSGWRSLSIFRET